MADLNFKISNFFKCDFKQEKHDQNQFGTILVEIFACIVPSSTDYLFYALTIYV